MSSTYEYINDLLLSHINNKLQDKLYTFRELNGDEIDDPIHRCPSSYLSKSSSESMYIKFYNGYLSSNKENFYIHITNYHISIVENYSIENKISNSVEYFNFMVLYNINLTYDELQNLQEKFKLLISSNPYSILNVYYTNEEEKAIGYSIY